MTTVRATTVDEVQEAVRAHARLRPVAGGTKSALVPVPAIASSPCERLDVSALAGIIDFQPAECTFTAWAGTRIADIEALLGRHGLYLPFEPPFGDRGATLGGTVATGLSGPGRLRYGGVRDFLLGVHFVDGEGRLVRGGGRVVKSAAGFSLQHLLLGSLGRLGVLTELTFKVFPRAPARVTLAAEFDGFARALDALIRVRPSTFELDAAELLPTGTLLLRLAGMEAAIDARVAELTAFLSAPARVATADPSGAAVPRETTAAAADSLAAPHGSGAKTAAAPRITRLTADAADRAWHEARELTWVDASRASRPGAEAPASGSSATDVGRGILAIVKVALTPSRIARLDARLREQATSAGGMDVPRRYGAGGEVAWIAWPGPLTPLHRVLHDLELQGLVLTGAPVAEPIIGTPPESAFLQRVRATLDPRGVFA